MDKYYEMQRWKEVNHTPKSGESVEEIHLKETSVMGNELAEEDQGTALLTSFDALNHSDQPVKRTGTTWTAIAHIITGVIGAGVLSLAWSMSQLGWVAGPLVIVVFAAITVLTTFILCECYMTPDPEYGPTRNRTFLDAVNFYLGKKNQRICGIFVLQSLYGCGVAYTVTASESVKAIQKSNCYHEKGHQADCGHKDYVFTLIFGLIQVVVSQIPDFHNMAWLSIVAAVMSFAYSLIGVGLALAKIVANGEFLGSITGVPAKNAATKLWSVFLALGDIAFAYPYSVIVLEIQDTLKSPPTEQYTMKKASMVSIIVTTFFYLCCGGLGYAAFGDNTPGNLLTGFGFYEPYWLVNFANACIILHLVGGYRIYSQPMFALVERWFSVKFPDSPFARDLELKLHPSLPAFELNVFRLCFRTLYVLSTTGVAMLFPYFNQVLGVLGAVNFWPMTVYFPLEMYLVQKKIPTWTKTWVVLQIFSAICLVISILGTLGSVERLISAKFS